ncbi:glycosyltransferase family 2 protein [Halobacillus amylolyticus]|uniref:Glycosyltransferase family 2 protein n=1 Tax=Halobacillus amylolyticus TaxID=2932259 RepID=A0ABY4HFX2_9BACI|nr:glycosyltransferase family 2 protein [Halobacillus amylolyticus]UOR13792.1 glycosyltransferase family 2 protein [Halobacillus amylolyticus]
MLETEKVSVVVPTYKVEKYIHRCVNSILKQTYENLEIILVNDGSPDQCGEIAEGYKQSDSRVKVFHKENGGLSDARNHGMKQVTGEFTMFVDSDDWLEPYAIEKMVHHSLAFKADVIQSAFYYAHEDYLLFDQRHYTKNGDLMILDNEKLMHELVKNETVKNFAWGKLYKTKLIRDIPFEKGVLFEDVFWAHQVMHRVNMFVILHEPLYNYYQRDDSIVTTYTPRNLDILKGLKERHAFIEKEYEELIDESFKTILKTSLIHYNLLSMNRKVDRDRHHRKEIQSYITDNYFSFQQAIENDKHLSLQLRLFYKHPYLNIFYLVSKKVVRKLKVFSKPVGLEKIKLKSRKEVQTL